jgi:hypothetical protein
MTDALAPRKAESHHRFSEFLGEDIGTYSLPLIPKISLIMNFNAAIWTGVVILILAVVRKAVGVQQIVDLTSLMVCLFIGAAVAALSICFDVLARKLYKAEAGGAKTLSRWAEVFDFTAIGVMLASMGVFVWGLFWGACLLRAILF